MKKLNTTKTRIILFALALFFCGVAIIFINLAFPTQIYQSSASDNITIIEEESFFSEFKVIDNMVYIFCKYTIENNSDEDVYFELIANMPNEQKSGLITGSKLIAYGVEKEQFLEINEDGNKTVPIITDGPVFKLHTHKTQEYYIVYTSKYGGTEKKQNRLLPITSLVEVYQ